MPTEVIVSVVGLFGILVGAVVNGLFAHKTDQARIEKLKAEADKARAEAGKVRAESEGAAVTDITFEAAEEFARSAAAILSRYILMELLVRLSYASRGRSRERNLVEVELFLSLNRKALYAHLSSLTDTARLAGTSFEYRDLLRASIYSQGFINDLRDALVDMPEAQASGITRADFVSVLVRIENSLWRAFENALSSPTMALLTSWEGEKFSQKYGL
jgi:hypothetical protein